MPNPPVDLEPGGDSRAVQPSDFLNLFTTQLVAATLVEAIRTVSAANHIALRPNGEALAASLRRQALNTLAALPAQLSHAGYNPLIQTVLQILSKEPGPLDDDN